MRISSVGCRCFYMRPEGSPVESWHASSRAREEEGSSLTTQTRLLRARSTSAFCYAQMFTSSSSGSFANFGPMTFVFCKLGTSTTEMCTAHCLRPQHPFPSHPLDCSGRTWCPWTLVAHPSIHPSTNNIRESERLQLIYWPQFVTSVPIHFPQREQIRQLLSYQFNLKTFEDI